MAITCRKSGCENPLKPNQMAFCSRQCLLSDTTRRQYPHRQAGKWKQYYDEWQERLDSAEDLTEQ